MKNFFFCIFTLNYLFSFFFLESLLIILPAWLRLIKHIKNQRILEIKFPKYFAILLLLSLVGMQGARVEL